MGKIRDFLREDRWTQGTAARDNNGAPVDINDPRACKWCLIGMIYKFHASCCVQIIRKLQTHLGPYTFLVEWNDSPRRRYSEVEKLVKEADI